MRTGYADACVLCPYFICLVTPSASAASSRTRCSGAAERLYEIRCRGVTPNSILCLRFKRKDEWKNYRKDFCRTDCYKGCTIYQAIEAAEETNE